MQHKFYLFILILAILAAVGYFSLNKKQMPDAPPAASIADRPAAATPDPEAIKNGTTLALPIANALSRVAKKPFGIFVSPKTSPVQPERFMGYHTGADFETFDDEQNINVPIFAVCDGTLSLKKYASGYGGVAVERCEINGNDVTIIYGHLRESSITPNIGQNIKAGQQIAVLGTGYSKETDGERKHLHLGIHKGTAVNILGYVQNQKDLTNWIDPLSLLK